MAIFHGTQHDDNLKGTSDDDTFDLYKGGEDTVSAGGDDDVINMGASLDAGDRLDGGTGRDVVNIRGDYSAGLTFQDLTLQNIEVLRLGRGFDYNLTLADGNVAAGETLTINAGALGAGNHLTFDGSLESDGRFAIYGGAGDDTITGGAKKDIFHLENGGNDTAHGGGGDDTFYLGGAFTGSDVIDGGTGTNTLSIDGSYRDYVTVAGGTVANVETLMLGGTYLRSIRVNGDITGGTSLAVNTSGITGTFSVDLSNATSSSYSISTGSSHGTIQFGSNFSASDTIASTGGVQLQLNGDYSGLTFSSAELSGVTTLHLLFLNSENLSIVGDIAAGAPSDSLAIEFLGPGEAPIFADLTQATTPSVQFVLSNDNAATVKFGGNLVAADTIQGHGSHLTLELDGDYSAGLALGGANGVTLSSLNTLKLDDGFGYKLVVVGDITYGFEVNPSSTLTIDGSAIAHGADAVTLDLSAATSPAYVVTGGAGDDTVTFGGNFTTSATFNGGGGSDTLELHGDYSAGYTFGAAQLTSIETLKLDDGFGYKLTTNDGNVATGAILTVDASALSGAHALTFDGSAENGGFFAITGGAGADSVTFGSHYSVSDTVDGGAGSDTLNLVNIQGSYTFTTTTITNVEDLAVTIADGNSATITTNDANVAAGATMIVDFSSSGPTFGVGITFDGSAETDGHFAFVEPSTASIMTLTGGAQSDTLSFTHGDSGSSNTFNGLGGDDTVTTTTNASSLTFDGGTGNDTLAFTGGGTENLDYFLTSVENVTFDDNNWTVGQRFEGGSVSLNVDATALSGGHTLTFNGVDTIDGPGLAEDSFVFEFAGNFISGDSLTGGAGNDTLSLNGDYSGGVTFGASTVVGIENIVVADGHDYTLVSNDTTVASGATLTVDGSALTSSYALSFDGGLETDGHFAFISGAGTDVLQGGAQSDTFDLSRTTTANAFGGGGNDMFTVTSAAMIANGLIDGGTGTDTLALNGDFSTQTAITASTVTSVEVLQLLGATHSYNLTFADAITTALTVDASAAASLIFSGAGDTTTAFTIAGSAGDDHIIGGNRGDTITGGLGADTLTGGGGADFFSYAAASESNSTAYDTITDLTTSDSIHIAGVTPTYFGAETVSAYQGSLDADLASALSGMTAGGYAVVTLNGGTDPLNGHTFLVVDGNGMAGYTAGADYVIDITNFSGDPSLIHFV